jgi:hypothetical protein
MKFLIEMIYTMIRQYVAKAASGFKNKQQKLISSDKTSEILQISYSKNDDNSMTIKPATSRISVTVPKDLIPLEKEGMLIDRLYNDIYRFATRYAGEFTKRNHSSDQTCSFFIIPKGDQTLYIQQHREWFVEAKKEGQFSNGEYRPVYTLFVSKNNVFHKLENFPTEKAKELYDLYDHKLLNQIQDKAQLETINQLTEFMRK